MGQDEIPGIGRQGAAAHHPNTGFGADQVDTVGVHTTEGAHIERHGGTVAVRGERRDGEVGVAYFVGAGNDVKRAAPGLSVNADGARQQIHLVHATGIEARAGYADGACGDAIGIETAIGTEHRRAGGEQGARGVDEAATVTGDAVGIDQYQLGTRPRDLGEPTHQARVGAGDFVQDNARAAAGEVGVALDVAAELGVGDDA